MSKPKKVKFILGITGTIGSGKSSVARMFKTKDALLIDADKLAHDSCKAGRPAYKRIAACFGKTVLKENKCIDRAKLAKAAFIDKAALNKLNGIVHKEVIAESLRLIKNSGKKFIILDAALLIEAGLRKMVDKLLVVKARRSQQILRSQKRLALSRAEVLRRMECQISQSEKLRLADFIIDNSGSIKQTRKQVSEIRRKLWKS
jgi:dephospho-CoA kinase